MSEIYVHGYRPRESERLQDQAGALVDLLHSDTAYPGGSTVLEAGCGIGAQTVTLARRSPGACITSVDVSAESIAEAERRVRAAGLAGARDPIQSFRHGRDGRLWQPRVLDGMYDATLPGRLNRQPQVSLRAAP